MMESISLLLATPIVKVILNKFYEGVGSNLAEKAVALLPKKVEHLGQIIWERCLKGKPGAEQLLKRSADGSAEDQKKLENFLEAFLEKNTSLKEEVKVIAEEINIEIQHDSSSMTQHVHSGGVGYQTKTGKENKNFFGGTHNHH